MISTMMWAFNGSTSNGEMSFIGEGSLFLK
jgi:hypothetical protein